MMWRLWYRLKYAPYDIRYGVRNLWRWFPLIWRDRDWDWAYLAELMEIKLRRLADCMENGYHVGGERHARQARTCAVLLKRLQEDDYSENAGYDEKSWTRLSRKEARRVIDHAENMAVQDQQYLGRLIAKHLKSWWD